MVYAYYRCSTESQMEKNGLQMQKDVVWNYCSANGIGIDGVFTDEGISGTKYDRDGVVELLATLKDGDKVIVQNTSRLWRDDVAKVMIQKEMKRAGADVLSVEQPNYTIYSKDPSDILFNGMMELLDQYERLTINMKLYRGRVAKAKSGNKACGNCPLGYKWECRNVVVDYNNNLIVKDIFDTYIAVKSLGKLVDYCKHKGYKTSRGCDFSKATLMRMLENKFYIGIVEYAGNTTQGNHEPIIEEDVFNLANSILKNGQ